ncbi:hypothetical protein NKH77_52800 [Streptomyces sp. M19]
MIVPARDGALRVLRAARAAGVRRTVLTSSFAAVGYGHGHVARTFTEDDWTDTEGPGCPRTSSPRRLPNGPPGTSSRPRATAWS